MRFPRLTDLDWLKDHIRDYSRSFDHDDRCMYPDEGCDCKAEPLAHRLEKLELTYKWILWSRRHAIIGRDRGMTPEYQVCFAMSLKYHRMLFDLPISKGEQALIAKAEKRMTA